MGTPLLFAALLFAVGFGLHCRRLQASEIHLIPEGYIGPVAIVFDADDGEAGPERENGALVFKI